MANSYYDIYNRGQLHEKEVEFEDCLKNWGKEGTDFTTGAHKLTVEDFTNLTQTVCYCSRFFTKELSSLYHTILFYTFYSEQSSEHHSVH